MLVFVGDLIDRGPSSAQVIERLRTYRRPGVQPVFLLGNHEEVLLRILGGDAQLITNWRWFGGAECLQSYGVDPDELAARQRRGGARAGPRGDSAGAMSSSSRASSIAAASAIICSSTPASGPGVELEQQSQTDLRWIREPFLFDDSDHGFVVVHGHTIAIEVEERPNRIGIDTGAYRTGVLTALAIEGTERWLLDTRDRSDSQPLRLI